MFENTKIEMLNERVTRLEEQLEAKERVLAICVDAEKITGLLEQLETAHAATEDTALAANLFREQRDRLQEQLEAAQAAYESERKTAMYLDGILAKHHETTGWNCPVCYPAMRQEGR